MTFRRGNAHYDPFFSPAPGSQDRLNRTDRLPGLPHQEGDVAELRDRGQEPHVLTSMTSSPLSVEFAHLSKAGFILED